MRPAATGAPPIGSPYDIATLRQLNALTSQFYEREAASFSATRQAPWRGWNRALDIIAQTDGTFRRHPLAVLDLACGNLRFERFLAERRVPIASVVAIDNCPALLDAPDSAVAFRSCDLIEALIADDFRASLPRATCDLAVAFGFMHHVAAFPLRIHVLEGLLDSLRPGGFAVVSFWQFLHDDRIAAKAATTTAAGRRAWRLPPLASCDYLLGWQHADGVYRFCHHTTDEEIDRLMAAVALPFREVARFSADGKHGNLNRYLVLQRP